MSGECDKCGEHTLDCRCNNWSHMPMTTFSIPPAICQYFDKFLLMDFLSRIFWRVKNEIIPLSIRKIKSLHVGKRREMDAIIAEFDEVYERKTQEQAEFKRKMQEKAQKRPHFSATGGTMQFKRVVSRG